MLFPTQRPQSRQSISPYPDYRQRHVGMNRNRFYRDRPIERSNTTSRGLNNMLGRILGSGGGSSPNGAGQGGGGLSKSLANIQQILNVVQSTAPIIQEYGPVVKNLPAMYRMMKAFKDVEKMEDGSSEKKGQKVENIKTGANEELDNTMEKSVKVEEKQITTSKKREPSGQSMPKLYI